MTLFPKKFLWPILNCPSVFVLISAFLFEIDTSTRPSRRNAYNHLPCMVFKTAFGGVSRLQWEWQYGMTRHEDSSTSCIPRIRLHEYSAAFSFPWPTAATSATAFLFSFSAITVGVSTWLDDGRTPFQRVRPHGGATNCFGGATAHLSAPGHVQLNLHGYGACWSWFSSTIQ